MSRNRPQVAIFVFLLLQMIAPISWWCTPLGGEGFHRGKLQQILPAHLLWKTPLLQVNNLNCTVAARTACLYSCSYSFPLWESLRHKIFILFFPLPPSLSANFLSREQFLEPFLFPSVFTAHFVSLSSVWTVVFAPPDCSLPLCYVGHFISGGLFFYY